MEKKSESLGFKDICLLILLTVFKSLNVVVLCLVLNLGPRATFILSFFYGCGNFFSLMERVVSDRRIWNNTVDIEDLKNKIPESEWNIKVKLEREYFK